jgi:hypothetical protein
MMNDGTQPAQQSAVANLAVETLMQLEQGVPPVTAPIAVPAAGAPAPAPAPAPSPAPAPAPAAPAASRYAKAPEQQPVVPSVTEPLPPEEPPGDPRVDPRAAHAYAQLRSENAKFKRELIPSLEAAKKTAEDANTALAAKLVKIEEEKRASDAEKTTLLERLGQVSLTESPQFREKYGSRELLITNKLTGALTKFAGLTPEQAQQFAQSVGQLNTPEDIAAATADMHPSVAGAVLLAAQELGALDEERRMEVSNWRQSLAASEVTGAREAVVRNAAERSRLAEDALEFAKQLGSPVYASPDPEDAEIARETSDNFRAFAQTATEQELLRAAAEGFSAPVLYKAIEMRDGVIEDLRQQLQGYRHASGMPVRSPSVTPVQTPIATNLPKPVAVDDPASMAREFARDAVGGFMSGVPM